MTVWRDGDLSESTTARKGGGHARGVEDQPDPIDVEVRIEWTDGSEEWLSGRAHRWSKSHVFVRFQDPRSLSGLVRSELVMCGACSRQRPVRVRILAGAIAASLGNAVRARK
jgi:hypothetical protein